MDILKREIAPITDAGWKAIDEQAGRTLRTTLTARKAIDVEGPHGWQYSALPLGHIKHVTRDDASSSEYGIRAVLPLVENRVFFELDTWELDNAERAAAEIDLGPLQQALQRAAIFEERAVLQGLPDAGIRGLLKSEGHAAVPLALNAGEVIGGIARAMALLVESAVGGPYALIAAPSVWQALADPLNGFSAFDYVKSLLGGPLLMSPLVDVAVLVSMRGGDYRLVLGQDFSIGYHSHTTEKVRLYITESFTFQVIESNAIAAFTL